MTRRASFPTGRQDHGSREFDVVDDRPSVFEGDRRHQVGNAKKLAFKASNPARVDTQVQPPWGHLRLRTCPLAPDFRLVIVRHVDDPSPTPASPGHDLPETPSRHQVVDDDNVWPFVERSGDGISVAIGRQAGSDKGQRTQQRRTTRPRLCVNRGPAGTRR